MTADEQRILDFLQETYTFQSAREIGIAASPPGGCANPTWAQPFLIRLTKARVLEMNVNGEFRLKDSERVQLGFQGILAARKAA